MAFRMGSAQERRARRRREEEVIARWDCCHQVRGEDCAIFHRCLNCACATPEAKSAAQRRNGWSHFSLGSARAARPTSRARKMRAMQGGADRSAGPVMATSEVLPCR